jgi:hypothetical protein
MFDYKISCKDESNVNDPDGFAQVRGLLVRFAVQVASPSCGGFSRVDTSFR